MMTISLISICRLQQITANSVRMAIKHTVDRTIHPIATVDCIMIWQLHVAHLMGINFVKETPGSMEVSMLQARMLGWLMQTQLMRWQHFTVLELPIFPADLAITIPNPYGMPAT